MTQAPQYSNVQAGTMDFPGFFPGFQGNTQIAYNGPTLMDKLNIKRNIDVHGNLHITPGLDAFVRKISNTLSAIPVYDRIFGVTQTERSYRFAQSYLEANDFTEDIRNINADRAVEVLTEIESKVAETATLGSRLAKLAAKSAVNLIPIYGTLNRLSEASNVQTDALIRQYVDVETRVLNEEALYNHRGAYASKAAITGIMKRMNAAEYADLEITDVATKLDRREFAASQLTPIIFDAALLMSFSPLRYIVTKAVLPVVQEGVSHANAKYIQTSDNEAVKFAGNAVAGLATTAALTGFSGDISALVGLGAASAILSAGAETADRTGHQTTRDVLRTLGLWSLYGLAINSGAQLVKTLHQEYGFGNNIVKLTSNGSVLALGLTPAEKAAELQAQQANGPKLDNANYQPHSNVAANGADPINVDLEFTVLVTTDKTGALFPQLLTLTQSLMDTPTRLMTKSDPVHLQTFKPGTDTNGDGAYQQNELVPLGAQFTATVYHTSLGDITQYDTKIPVAAGGTESIIILPVDGYGNIMQNVNEIVTVASANSLGTNYAARIPDTNYVKVVDTAGDLHISQLQLVSASDIPASTSIPLMNNVHSPLYSGDTQLAFEKVDLPTYVNGTPTDFEQNILALADPTSSTTQSMNWVSNDGGKFFYLGRPGWGFYRETNLLSSIPLFQYIYEPKEEADHGFVDFGDHITYGSILFNLDRLLGDVAFGKTSCLNVNYALQQAGGLEDTTPIIAFDNGKILFPKITDALTQMSIQTQGWACFPGTTKSSPGGPGEDSEEAPHLIPCDPEDDPSACTGTINPPVPPVPPLPPEIP